MKDKMTIKLQTQMNYTPPPGDKMVKESITEQSGYIPAKVQVERMIMAGQRLDDYKKEVWDIQADEKIDPEQVKIIESRDRNFDMADATRIQNYLKEKLREKARAKERNEEGLKKLAEQQELEPNKNLKYEKNEEEKVDTKEKEE